MVIIMVQGKIQYGAPELQLPTQRGTWVYWQRAMMATHCEILNAEPEQPPLMQVPKLPEKKRNRTWLEREGREKQLDRITAIVGNIRPRVNYHVLREDKL